ncbi:MAG: hypothetical protein QM758_19770 [Armatimonas sp.]
MARRSTAAAATAETEVKPVVRRRRRRTTVDHAAQTSILVSALLKSRAESGAAQSAIISVIEWARGVHEEDAAMRQLKTRPRRAKAEISAERVAKFDVNKALLDGVLAGTVGINVDDEGNIIFLSV